jgi:DNA polymerase-3 subunit epsilon
MVRLAGALARLRLAPWPFAGRIALREADTYRGVTEIHVLDQWRHLGSARTETELAEVLERRELPPFDIDHYRLLTRHLSRGPDVLALVNLAKQPVW